MTDDAAQTTAPGARAQGAILTTDPHTIQPNIEEFMCQTFANPFGRDVDLVSIESTTSAAHDVSVYRMSSSTGPTQPTPLQSCDPTLPSQPFLHFTHEPNAVTTYPRPDMGYPLAAMNAILVRVRYINPESAPLDASATISLTPGEPGSVTEHVGSIFLVNPRSAMPTLSPSQPPSGPATPSSSWTPAPGVLPQNYTFFNAWVGWLKETHPLDAQASANGSVFLDENRDAGTLTSGVPDPSLRALNPAVPMAADQSLTWSCTYADLTSANGAECVYQGQYVPADPKNPDLIQVQPLN